MKEFSIESKVLLNTEKGPIVEISFQGDFRAVDSGRVSPSAISEELKRIVVQRMPAAILLNFTEVIYKGGDFIACVIPPLGAENQSIRPACIVSTEETAKALRWLYEAKTAFHFLGIELHTDLMEGLEFLKKRLGVES